MSWHIEQTLVLAERAFRAGHELALYDAIVIGGQDEQPLPKWVIAAVEERGRLLALGQKPKKKLGRHSSARAEQEQIIDDCRTVNVIAGLREEGRLQLDEAIERATDHLNRSPEAIHKAYYRHKRRIASGNYYVSFLSLGDIVEYTSFNPHFHGILAAALARLANFFAIPPKDN
jgi:hypothetical protein